MARVVKAAVEGMITAWSEFFGDLEHEGCKECGRYVYKDEHFCSERCLNNFWIGISRKSGM